MKIELMKLDPPSLFVLLYLYDKIWKYSIHCSKWICHIYNCSMAQPEFIFEGGVGMLQGST